MSCYRVHCAAVEGISEQNSLNSPIFLHNSSRNRSTDAVSPWTFQSAGTLRSIHKLSLTSARNKKRTSFRSLCRDINGPYSHFVSFSPITDLSAQVTTTSKHVKAKRRPFACCNCRLECTCDTLLWQGFGTAIVIKNLCTAKRHRKMSFVNVIYSFLTVLDIVTISFYILVLFW